MGRQASSRVRLDHAATTTTKYAPEWDVEPPLEPDPGRGGIMLFFAALRRFAAA
jgi:hypothetical protein